LVHRELGNVRANLAGSWMEYLWWGLRLRSRFVVRGDSMLPALRAGDHVLVDPRAYRGSPPLAGDVVVARHPFQKDRLLIKRIASVDAKGRAFLEGDNPESSTDSHALGALSPKLLIGRVTRRILE